MLRGNHWREALLALAALAAMSQTEARADGPSAGARSAPPAAFGACSACHAVTPNAAPGIGPNLHGVVGRRAGAQAGFNFSPALRQSGVVWSRAELQRFLQNPAETVPGTTMPGVGAMSAADREAIVAYLAELR